MASTRIECVDVATVDECEFNFSPLENSLEILGIVAIGGGVAGDGEVSIASEAVFLNVIGNILADAVVVAVDIYIVGSRENTGTDFGKNKNTVRVFLFKFIEINLT